MLERRELRVRSPEPYKILSILVCRKSQVDKSFIEEKMKPLRENLKSDIKILEYVVVNEEKDIPILKEHLAKADGILIYKPHLGLGDCIIKISEFDLPTILFNDDGMVNNPLDALEYIYPKEKFWVAVDYQDLNNILGVLLAKKKMEQTKILVLNAEYPHWQRFICRVHGGSEAIKEKLGITTEYVKSEEVIRRWQSMDEE
ncbi:MAG: hypothetical protein ACUVUF_06835, partial [Candidatus Bathycorpusculaceae bacterium]